MIEDAIQATAMAGYRGLRHDGFLAEAVCRWRDVEKLSTLIDRDLSFWLTDPAETRSAETTISA